MADSIGSSSTYKVSIPAFGDPADIQTAFKLYHYGSATVPANNGAIVTDTAGDIGVAGHLKNLETLKANLAGPTFTGTVVLPSTTSIGNVSSTEISYLDGVTSAVQTQINAKANIASPTFTGTVVLPDSTITTVMVNNLAITTDKIAATAVTEAKIGNGAVTVNKLGDLAVTNAKIADGTIQNSKLANKSVTINNQTVDLGGSITINSINAASDLVFEQAGFNNYSILYNSSYNVTDTLTPGTAGTLLVSNGTNGAPGWTQISNTHVASNAAISYSKLNLGTSIKNSDIATDAAIVDTKLATISTANKVSNSATTATAINTTNAIVARDNSGNFAANTITATLSGNASTATTAGAATSTVTYSGTLTTDTYGAVGNRRIFVGAGEPKTALGATPQPGDLWMW